MNFLEMYQYMVKDNLEIATSKPFLYNKAILFAELVVEKNNDCDMLTVHIYSVKSNTIVTHYLAKANIKDDVVLNYRVNINTLVADDDGTISKHIDILEVI